MSVVLYIRVRGKIEPQNPCHTAIQMIDVLKLNDPSLVSERKKIVQYIMCTFFSDDPDTTDEIQNEIDDLNTPDTDGRLRGFSQVSKRYLEEEILLF